MTSSRPLPTLVPLVLLALAACGGDGGGGGASAFAVRDSAGIAIAASEGPAWGEGEGWRVSEEPVVDIGVAEGAPAYQLDGVSDAVRLSDGRIVVANGEREIRLYDARGRHLRTVGRKGGGPGEFQSLSWLGRIAGDSIAAWDPIAARLSILSPAGDFVRAATLRLPEKEAFAMIAGAFTDGTLLVTSAGANVFPSGQNVQRDTVPYLRYSTAGALVDTVSRVAGPQTFSTTGSSFAVRLPLPFGPGTYHAVSGDRVYLGDSERAEVAVLDGTGALRRLVRWPWKPEALTPAEIAAHKEKELEDASSGPFRAMIEKALAQVPFPERKAAYERMLADAAGNVWVKAYAAPGADEAPWTVFDPEGRMLGRVVLPEALRVEEIGSDYLLALREDDVGAQHVVVHRLEKRE